MQLLINRNPNNIKYPMLMKLISIWNSGQPDKTRSSLALCAADRFVLTFSFFLVKQKEH